MLKRAHGGDGFPLVASVTADHVVGVVGHDAADGVAPAGDVVVFEAVEGFGAVGLDFVVGPAAGGESGGADGNGEPRVVQPVGGFLHGDDGAGQFAGGFEATIG